MASAELKKSRVHEGLHAATYREFVPSPFLAASVECFWTSTVPTARRTSSFHRVLPDGCMDVLFDFMAAGSQRASVIGTMTQALTFTTTGPVDLLGIRFRPGGLSGVFPVNAAELTDGRVDLTNFWGRLAGEAWHRVGEATPAKRVEVLQGL